MERRNFIKVGVLGISGLSLGCSTFSLMDKVNYTKNEGFNYLVSDRIDANIIPLPSTMQVPFKWNWVGIDNDAIIIHFKKLNQQKITPALFRISVAIDIREQKLVEVFLPKSNRKLGVIDIKYSPVFQPFELQLSAKDVEDVFIQGIALKQIKGNSPLWIFQPGPKASISNNGLMPHLLFNHEEIKPMDSFYANFLSLNVVQSFGWMEGCVLDGLMDLNKRFSTKVSKSYIDSHLHLFLDQQNNLQYEGPFSKPYTNTFYGIEALLPFAAIAQLYPKNTLLPEVAKYCISKKDENGLIHHNDVTTEGCYTIAYPLAAIAIALQQKELANIALDQLILRKNLLVVNQSIHQRMDENKLLNYPNWARGVAWYLLGTVRTLSVLDEDKDISEGLKDKIVELKQEFIRAANWVINLQDKSGLWFCFLDQPETGIDTSGSAGIAAALAIGTKKGYLSSNFTQPSENALKGLLKFITTDGFLSGAAQANKGGIALQKNGYRVISQYASGLMAQLIAATNN